jgi:hypothetical protein
MPNTATAVSNPPLPTEAEAESHLHNQLQSRAPGTTSRVRRPRLTPFRSARINNLHRALRTAGFRRLCGKGIDRLRNRAERGAVTAEYAIMIVGACAIGGVLVALLRSPAMQNALKAIINYGLKIAGVEGVHI